VPGPTLAIDLPARRTFPAVFKVQILLFCLAPYQPEYPARPSENYLIRV
jgi:hypothetical protein